jgi:hypothetical protein
MGNWALKSDTSNPYHPPPTKVESPTVSPVLQYRSAWTFSLITWLGVLSLGSPPEG